MKTTTLKQLEAMLDRLAKYGMAGTYAGLLLYAEAAENVQVLHDSVVPSNQRLKRKDLVPVKQMWHKIRDRDGRIHHEALLLLLSAERKKGATFRKYYMEELFSFYEDVARGFDETYGGDVCEVWSFVPEDGSRGIHDFVWNYCCHTFDVRMAFVDDKLVIQLSTSEKLLDEDLVRRMELCPGRHHLRVRRVGAAGSRVKQSSSHGGSQLDFFVILDANLREHCKTFTKMSVRPRREHAISTNAFLRHVEEALMQIGFQRKEAFLRIHAIIPWDEDICLPDTKFPARRDGYDELGFEARA